MAFCTSCGAQLTGPFCLQCGQRAQAPSPARPQSTPQPAMQAAAQPVQASAQPMPAAPQATQSAPAKSGFAKALLIIGGIVLLLFVMGLAATFYGMYWVKHKVASYTGIGSSTPAPVALAHGNSCALLSREDLQQVLGVAIDKTAEITEGSEPGCAYYTNPAAFTELQKMTLEEAKRDSEHGAQQPVSKTDNPLALLKDTKDMEGMVKSFGLMQPDKDGRVFTFTINRSFGRSNWGPLRATMSAVPGFEDVDGVADRAMIGSFGHALYVLKGDSVISMETMYVPDTRVRGAEIGRRIASHL
ncbi:MAG TPA: hypothetical protein VFJ47_04010 [Terriglobales bacterium]|nr:hypothetical protein [Terriglobales bacterium]